MKKIFIILILFLTNCGYQPIYLNKELNINDYDKIILSGNLEINRTIIKSLAIKENKSSTSNNELTLKSSHIIEETSKNSKGEIISYRSTVVVDLSIKKNKEKRKNKNFVKTFSYNNTVNKFDLRKYQKEVKKNLVEEAVKEMIIYLNLK